MDKVLANEGWTQVQNKEPPKGEEILLGETINGVFNYFTTEVTRPFKKMDILYFFYKKDSNYEVLRSDQYWKNT